MGEHRKLLAMRVAGTGPAVTGSKAQKEFDALHAAIAHLASESPLDFCGVIDSTGPLGSRAKDCDPFHCKVAVMMVRCLCTDNNIRC